MTYLLDTDTCVALIRDNPPRARARFVQAAAGGKSAAVSSITAFELWYGAAKGRHREDNLRAVETFFAGPVEFWPFEDNDARAAGEIRADLEVSGRLIGPYDLLIAGQAISRRATVVTANTKEFGRIRGLEHEDWVS